MLRHVKLEEIEEGQAQGGELSGDKTEELNEKDGKASTTGVKDMNGSESLDGTGVVHEKVEPCLTS